MELSWVRVGDLAVLWELQALRNLYFIAVILLCVIVVG
jgi:hypothetical protein